MNSDDLIDLEYREWQADPDAAEERWAEERRQAEDDAAADWQRWEDEHQESAAP